MNDWTTPPGPGPTVTVQYQVTDDQGKTWRPVSQVYHGIRNMNAEHAVGMPWHVSFVATERFVTSIVTA